MSSGQLLDTRTPYRRSNTDFGETPLTSQTGTPGLTLFKRAVQNLIDSSHQERAARRKNVINRLRSSRDPVGYINELIDHCVVKGGSEGLDIGIDVLAEFGDLVIQYAHEFRKKDANRWSAEKDMHRHHFNDDVWYILLRSAARSDLDLWQKIPIALYCAKEGPMRVREAAVHAFGDVGGAAAASLLGRLRDADRSPIVREAAAEVLNDMEG